MSVSHNQTSNHDNCSSNPVSHTLSFEGYDVSRACISGDLSMLILLWGSGASVHHVQNGGSPLHWAALYGHVHCVTFLLKDPSVKVDVLGHDRQTPLMWGAAKGHLRVCEVLLEYGAKLDIQDARGYTAFHHAVQNRHLPVLHLLTLQCSHSMIPRLTDNDDHTLLHWCVYQGDLSMTRYCCEVLALNVNDADKLGRGALHWACREGSKEVSMYLLGCGAARDAVCHEGRTPIQEAQSRGHVDVVEALQQFAISSPLTPYGSPCVALGTLSLFLADRRQRILFLFGILLGAFWIQVSYLAPACFVYPLVGLYHVKWIVWRWISPSRCVYSNDARRVDEALEMDILHPLAGPARNKHRDLCNFGIMITVVMSYWFHFEYTELGTVFQSVVSSFLWKVSGVVLLGLFLYLKIRSVAHVLRDITGPMSAWTIIQSSSSSKQNVASSLKQICFNTNTRAPLRSAWVPEIDARVHEYDHFDYILDVAVGAGNIRCHVLFIIMVSVHCFVTAWITWHWTGAVCPNPIPTNILHQLFLLLVRSTICPRESSVMYTARVNNATQSTDFTMHNQTQNEFLNRMSPLSATAPEMSSNFLIPTTMETLGFWGIVVPLVLGLICLLVSLQNITLICMGLRRYDITNNATRGEHGVTVPVFIQRRGLHVVFSEPSHLNLIPSTLEKCAPKVMRMVRNVLVFLRCRAPCVDWTSLYEVPQQFWIYNPIENSKLERRMRVPPQDTCCQAHH